MAAGLRLEAIRGRSGLRPFNMLVAVLATLFASIAIASVDGQCDASGGDPSCAAASAWEGDATAAPGMAPELLEAEMSPRSDDVGDEFVAGNASGKMVRIHHEANPWALAFVLSLGIGVLLWILAMIKFAVDGSLPARLALWGLLPEAYAAISVRSVVALLRLKQVPTPVVVLRNCVTDAGAAELADALRRYGTKSDLQALELPHNPQMSVAGVQSLVAAALDEASTLQEIELSYNPQLGGATVVALQPLLRLKASKISTLRLADCGLKVSDLTVLADSLGNSPLRTLDLSLNDFAAGGAGLASILEAPVLEELMVAKCDLSAEDVRELAEQLPYTSLKSLQLGGNRFGAQGVAFLAQHLPRSQIDELGLEAVGIEASDLNALAAAWVKRPFARIKLHGNRMSREEISGFVNTLKSMHA